MLKFCSLIQQKENLGLLSLGYNYRLVQSRFKDFQVLCVKPKRYVTVLNDAIHVPYHKVRNIHHSYQLLFIKYIDQSWINIQTNLNLFCTNSLMEAVNMLLICMEKNDQRQPVWIGIQWTEMHMKIYNLRFVRSWYFWKGSLAYQFLLFQKEVVILSRSLHCVLLQKTCSLKRLFRLADFFHNLFL